MGNVLSSGSVRRGSTTTEAHSESLTMDATNASCDNDNQSNSDEFHDANNDSDDNARVKAREDALSEFTKDLSVKREQRKAILARHRAEKEDLEKSLANEIKNNMDLQETNKILRDLLIENNINVPEEIKFSAENAEVKRALELMNQEVDKARTNNIKLRRELAESNRALQSAFSDIADLNTQNTESIKQINALKEVISVSKTLMGLREEQLTALKNKLTEIEQSMAEREASMLSADLRQEYERQLQNIRALRVLYEERARLAEVTRQGILRELEEQKSFYQIEVNKNMELKAQMDNLEIQINDLKELLENKNDEISSLKDETRGLQAEMTVVNKLFSQVLLGYKNKQDLDKLVHRLEENHGLLTQMAGREDGSEASSELPKLLLQLVSQVDEGEERIIANVANENATESKESKDVESFKEALENQSNTTPEEIVENLPKVWRVLMELLSHQNVVDTNATEKVTTCYKSVETKSGPVLVPSVSQTYIRLKDLIVEKLSLVKEVNRMKQLNTHLESRLGEQEKRLCLVTSELSKTWHVVGRLRRHHHQLHTHEKILKYELQQKRKLLNELKVELEYCREKWDQAREKNTQSEKDWKKLRAEFSGRKTKPIVSSLNNSAESGYSDERQSDSSDSNDDSEYLNEPVVRCKKKLKKSFETIIDSSTDINLAEREDPVSDMLDVADLPLDTQEGDENRECSISECGNSDNLLKSEETEDEVGDIANEFCIEESSAADIEPKSGTSQASHNTTSENRTENTIVTIDPAAIMESIKRQNERLAKRDKKLESLEKSSEALLRQMQNTSKVEDSINSTLDHLINRPSGSHINTEQAEKSTSGNAKLYHILKSTHDSTRTSINGSVDNDVTMHQKNETLEERTNCEEPSCSSDKSSEDGITPHTSKETGIPKIDPKTIMESIKRQNERLARKDERLRKLEDGCALVVKNIANTLDKGDEIIHKIDTLHEERQLAVPEDVSNDNKQVVDHQDTIEEVQKEEDKSMAVQATDEPGPSTSTDADHEARFAARDLRLTKLEEQTRSLVNRVNKTTSKGVKINYKLEELHNIYGSESSRAGTPSEGNEEPSEGADNDDTE